ncbi:MAG: peptide chain release factor 3, partial [Firmicutes bacterium]|nr:peptide chain release factor 3 [Bacillota bacterium]
VYRNEYNEVIVGAVGQLQFEVFQYRLENEYNAKVRMDRLDMTVARWLGEGQDTDRIKDMLDSRQMLVYDRMNRPLLLFANSFTMNYFTEKHGDVELIEPMNVKSTL